MGRIKDNAIPLGFAGSGFLVGACAGVAATAAILTRRYRRILQQEREELRSYYQNRNRAVRAEDAPVSSAEEAGGEACEADEDALASSSAASDESDGETTVGNVDVGELPDSSPELEGIDGEESEPDLLPDSDFIDVPHVADHEENNSDNGVTRTRTRRPQTLSLEEFCDPPAGFQQSEVTYYASDKILVDSDDKPIPNIGRTVGRLAPNLFGGISKDPRKRYVRNHDLQLDFEIILNDGSFADLVLNYGRPT